MLRLLLFVPVLLPLGAAAQTVNNGSYARDQSAQVVKNPFGLCWRSGQWRPEEAIAECDPDLVPKPKPAAAAPAPVLAAPPQQSAPTLQPAPPPVAIAPAAPPPAAEPVRPKPQAITLGADAAFDTGKADLKPEGQARIDELAAKLKGVSYDSITVTGHTDNVGGQAANQRLSERRAEAVKTYLVARGVDASKIRTSGRGMASPVTDNKTAQGRARNRRVEVEIAGTRL